MILQHTGPLFRQAKPGGAGFYMASRDAKLIDCRAVGCTFNVNRQCAVPTMCRINETGGCNGFQAKPLHKIGGD